MILTRKSHNCAGTAFVQGDSAGGSKLIEQTMRFLDNRKCLEFLKETFLFGFQMRSKFSEHDF